jgi:hypothetical protein
MKMVSTSDTVYIFDLDDTLVKTDARIKVFCSKSKKLLHSLTPSDYNYYIRKADHVLNFEDFDDLNILLSGKLIDENIQILKKASQKHMIGIVTARAHLGSVVHFVQDLNLPVNQDLIYVVNDPIEGFWGTVSERKKQAFKRMVDQGKKKFIYYDDSSENLEKVKELEDENPGVEIKTHHVYA